MPPSFNAIFMTGKIGTETMNILSFFFTPAEVLEQKYLSFTNCCEANSGCGEIIIVELRQAYLFLTERQVYYLNLFRIKEL